MTKLSALAKYLIGHRLAGDVTTTVQNTLGKLNGLRSGDPRCSFGLDEYRELPDDRVREVITSLTGASLDAEPDSGFIDPQRTIEGLLEYRKAIIQSLAGPHLRILFATGHPSGLLQHYAALAARFQQHGHTVMRPYDDGPTIKTDFEFEPESTVRYVADVACVYRKPGALAHSHLAHYMERMLAELDDQGALPDLVVADHGMAGAAVARGLPVIAIADVNDLPLLFAGADGRLRALLVIDDNRPAATFAPITEFILEEMEHDVLPAH